VDLDLLVTFLHVYRCGSLTAAAAAQGVSQPAVSGRLARLEQEVGEPLFLRSARGVVPTERAHDLALRAGPHLDRLQQALLIERAPAPALGRIRLGGAAEVMTARVLPSLSPLVGEGLRIHATFGVADDLLAALAEARLDLVVSAVRPALRGVEAVPLVDEEFVLVGPPAARRDLDEEAMRSDPVRALSHLPLVAYSPDLPIVRRYWRSEFGRRPPNEVSVIAPDLRAVLAAVVAGAGISVLPRYLAEPAMSAGSVEELHRPVVPPLNTLYLATASGSRDPSTAAVRRHLLARAQEWTAF
jgi:DNA-binding transcriptional LysR family regulator